MTLAEAIKSALAIHHTGTSTDAWDGAAAEARIPNDAGAGALHRFFAWIDPNGNPDQKNAYKFGHHDVGTDGIVGAANLAACSTGIGVLNGGRTGTTIPRSDYAGVHAHLAAHLSDAGRTPPPLKSATEIEQEEPLASAVKFVGADTVEGPLFLFNRDLQGERFTPETDLCLEWFGKSGRPLLYEHGMDGTLKTGLIGRQIDYELRDEGLWAQAELNRAARFRKGIDALIERGALAYSGGAMQHLATKSVGGDITRFPWVETSLTPTPANPANAGVYYLKSALAIEHLEEADIALPAPLKVALSALDEWAATRERAELPNGTPAPPVDLRALELEALALEARLLGVPVHPKEN